jgi:signal transduction histidine kinase
MNVPYWWVTLALVHNALLTLLAALMVEALGGRTPAFGHLNYTIIFLGIGAFAAPALSALASVWVIVPIVSGAGGWPNPLAAHPWVAFRRVALSNSIPFATLTIAIVMFVRHGSDWLRAARWTAVAEAAGAGLALLIACQIAFGRQDVTAPVEPALLYLPLPFLLWSAVRFGPAGASAFLVAFVLGLAFDAIDGRGPFRSTSTDDRIFTLQAFILSVAIPIQLLAAVVWDWRQTMSALQSSKHDQQRMGEELRDSFGQIRALAGRLISAQEVERARIARELHDDLSQQLAAMSLGLSAVRRKLPEGAQKEMSQLQRAAIELANEVRNLSHELHPGVLQHAGLVAALRARCVELRARSDCEVVLEADERMPELPAEVSLCLYRVAQEAVGNVVRHADARRMRLIVSRDAAGAELTIQDDGRGFDPAQVRSLGGLGLISLEERVRLLKGNLSVRSAPGCGTELRVRIPLEDGEDHGTHGSIAGGGGG